MPIFRLESVLCLCFCFFCLFFLSSTCLAQRCDIIDGYVTFQYTGTIEDLTRGNNPWGIGTGLQVYFNVGKLFRPIAEVTGDIYLENDKVMRLGPNEEAMLPVETISKVLAGPSLQMGGFMNAAVAGGPSFVNNDIFFTLKPSLNIFLNKRQSVFFKAAYIHVYNRGNMIRRDFTSCSAGVGFKVF